jgi:hypothetical protein
MFADVAEVILSLSSEAKYKLNKRSAPNAVSYCRKNRSCSSVCRGTPVNKEINRIDLVYSDLTKCTE